MTTKETDNAERLEKLNKNVARIEELSQRLIAALAQKKQVHPGLQRITSKRSRT